MSFEIRLIQCIKFQAISLNPTGTFSDIIYDITNSNKIGYSLLLFEINNELEAQRFINNFHKQIEGENTHFRFRSMNEIHKLIKIQKIDPKSIYSLKSEKKEIFDDYVQNHLKSFYEANKKDFKEIKCNISKVSRYNWAPRTSLDDDKRNIRGLQYLYILGDREVKYNQVSKLKIGIAKDLNRRFYDYLTHSPKTPKIIAHYPIPTLIKPSKVESRRLTYIDAERIENVLKSKLFQFWMYQEWFYIAPKDLIKIVRNILLQKGCPFFSVTSFTDKYGDRFFISYEDTNNEKKVLMYHRDEIFLMSDIYGTFEKNKIKKIKTFKNLKKDKYDNKFQEIWEYLVNRILKY